MTRIRVGIRWIQEADIRENPEKLLKCGDTAFKEHWTPAAEAQKQ